jgi:dTDP-glucose 4,6-dehydratase
METMIVTGGAGFIGSNYVRHALATTDARVVVVDKLTYAGNFCSIQDLVCNPRFVFIEADIADRGAMESVFANYRPTWILNFAAESHVDRSIDDARPFIDTNIVGTYQLLDVSHHYLKGSSAETASRFRFLHISTDEVYGTLGESGYFTEETAYAPNSPYAASKASADHLVRAYYETFHLPALITNCSNNYGPYQFPEKLIPLTLLNAIDGKPLPIYGDGANVRDWLYVQDHCSGITLALMRGQVGGKYNIGGSNELTNVQVVDRICAVLDDLMPAAENAALKMKGLSSYGALKSFVEDRPGQDRRYAIDAAKIRSELGWRPEHDFDRGITATVQWYLQNRDWCSKVQAGKYARERLGLRPELSRA